MSDVTTGAMIEMLRKLDALSGPILESLRAECKPEKWVADRLQELESEIAKQDGNHAAVRAAISYLDDLKYNANLAGTRRLPKEQLEFCQLHTDKIRESFKNTVGIE